MYFKSYQNETEENCKLFFKEKLKDIFQNTDLIKKEITKCNNSIKYTRSSFANILNKLENLKDNDNNKITYKIEYDHINKFTKKIEKLNMFIIMKNNMCIEIRDNNIYQFLETQLIDAYLRLLEIINYI